MIPIKYEKVLSIVGDALRIALHWQTRDGTQERREALATRLRGQAKCSLSRLGGT